MNVYAHPLAALLWLLVIAGEFLVAFIALVQRTARPQRFFGGLALITALRDVMLFAASFVGAASFYFHTYWPTLLLCYCCAAVQACLCYKDLFYPPDSMPKRFHRQFAGLLLLLTVVVALSHLYVRHQQVYTAADSLMLFYRSGVLWLCGFYWIITGLAQHWCLRLHSKAYGVSMGMMFNLTTNLFLGAAFSSIRPEHIPSLYFIQMAGELITIIIWLRYFMRLDVPVYSQTGSPMRRLRESFVLSIWGELGVARKPLKHAEPERQKCRIH